jgi:uncharacterized membrane protein YbhN (UPF0104 family)
MADRLKSRAQAVADATAADARPRPGLLRSWRSVVFAPVGDGQRRRRGTDGIRLATAVLALVGCLLVIRYDSRVDRAIAQVIHPPPWSITWLVTVVYDLGSFGVTIALVALALIARRWVVARDIALSAAVAAAASGIVILLLGGNGGRPAGVVIDDYSLSFPVWRIVLFMAVTTAALPYLGRGVQRIIEIFIALVALAAAVGGQGLPLNVGGSLAIGWGAAVAVRLVFGSPLGLPSADDVLLLLRELGIGASGVHPVKRQVWGVARYQATETGPDGSAGGRLGVEVYGRDAADAKLLTKAGRFLLYRDSGPTFTITRLQQVERQAYLTLRASQAGAAVTEFVEAGTAGPAMDALLVCRLPSGPALADADAGDISDAALDSLYRQLLILRRARIAHGAISGDTLLLDPAANTIVLSEFRNASSGASPDQLDGDIAGAMAATAVTVGAERAAGAAARCLPPDILEGALRQLHAPALDPSLRPSLRRQRDLLKDVRQRAADAASIEVPELVEPRRVSWPTLIMIIGTLIGGWALIGVLIDVSKSFDTVIGAEWLWVIMALVLAQLAYVASAVESVGSVAGPLPFARVLGVEIANSFSALAGGTAAVFATRVRFYQQQGYDASVALSSGAIMATVSWISTGVLFLISLPFAWGSIHLDVGSHLSGDSRLVWIILAVVVLVALAAGVVLAVPRLRRLAAEKARPKVRDIVNNFREVARSPTKLVLLAGGAVGRDLLIAMAMSVSLRAFGDHLRLPILIVVITLAGMIGGASPSPGGMGVVEAGLILGLTAAGVDEADATAAVFVQRLFTSYLPPIWGWLALVWMRKRQYLLRRQPVRAAEQERGLPDRVQPQRHHQQAAKAQAEAAVRRAPVAEAVQVVPHRLRAQALLRRLAHQDVVAVLALRARGDLDATPQQVETARQLLLSGRAHVIEGPNGRGVLRHEHELVPGALGHARGDGPLPGRVQVRPLARGAEELMRVRHGDPRERDARDGHLGPEVLPDRRAVLRRDRAQDVRQHPLLEVHDVLDAGDPGEFGVHAGELGRVPRGERRLGAEHRADLENPVNAGRDGHLLVELRRLRQEGAAAEVAELEHLGAGLRRGPHELRRVHLRAPAVVGELAHRPLGRGLHREDQLRGGAPPDVEETPVEPSFRPGVLVDRERRGGEVLDRHPLRDDLEAAEADDRVGYHPAGHADGRLGGQPAELSFQGAPVPAVGDLHDAGVVTDEHELHRAL